MAFPTGERKALSQWSCKISIEFVDLPVEKESAYWAAVDYFAQVLFEDFHKDLTAPSEELEAVRV